MPSISAARLRLPPTVKLKVSRDEINKGDPVTVSWEVKKDKTVELNGQKVEKIGARTVTPEQTTTFEVKATLNDSEREKLRRTADWLLRERNRTVGEIAQ